MRPGIFVLVSVAAVLSIAACGNSKSRPPRPFAVSPAVKLAFTSISSPVEPYGSANVYAKVGPDEDCQLDFQAPGVTKSAVVDLGAKRADSTGIVSWTWTIGGNSDLGRGELTLTCGSQMATADIYLVRVFHRRGTE